MSRKRKAKKQLKQQSELGAKLGQLYERGAYEEVLVVCQRRVPNPDRSEHADFYLGAINFLLTQAFEQGNLDEAFEVAQTLGGSATSLPLVKLARAIRALQDGEKETAAELLDEVATDSEGGIGPGLHLSEIVSSLLLLCLQPNTKARQLVSAEKSVPGFSDLRKLEKNISELTVSPDKATTKPRSIGLAGDPAQGAWDLARTLEVVAARNFRPTSRQVSALGVASSILDQQVHPSGMRAGAASMIARFVRLIAVVAEDFKRLRSRRGHRRFEHVVEQAQEGRYRELEKLMVQNFEDRLLGHLQHILRLEWHDLVAFLAEEDNECLVGLAVSHPGLFKDVVRCESTGSQNARASVLVRNRARDLLDMEDWISLHELLDSQLDGESDPLRVAMMRAIQLKLILLRAQQEDADIHNKFDDLMNFEEFDDFDDFDGFDTAHNPHDAFFGSFLNIVDEVGKRIPGNQRAGVGRFLRDELLEAMEELEICSHFGRAAVGLLEYLPHDVLLLITGFAAFVNVDEEIAGRIRLRIAEKGPRRAVDVDAVSELLSEIVRSSGAETCLRVLEGIRPLFTDKLWCEISGPGASFFKAHIVDVLSSVDEEGWDPGEPRGLVSRIIEDYLPYWDGVEAFEVARACADCVFCKTVREAQERLDQFHAACPAIEAAVDFMASMAKASVDFDASSAQRQVCSSHAAWMVCHPDQGSGPWISVLPLLIFHLRERDHILMFQDVVSGLLEDDDLSMQPRLALIDSLEILEENLGGKKKTKRRSPKRKKAKKKIRKKSKSQAGDAPPDESESKTKASQSEEDDAQMAFDFGLEL